MQEGFAWTPSEQLWNGILLYVIIWPVQFASIMASKQVDNKKAGYKKVIVVIDKSVITIFRMRTINMPLKNKVVVISGANGNLGRAVAALALEQGARLALLDLAFGPNGPDYPSDRVVCHKLNMLDQQATIDCFKNITESVGPIDALCNTAGGFAMGKPVHETGDQDWSAMFDLNVRTLLNTARAVVPGMIERRTGRIVNVAAAGALTGSALMAPYIAAKSAVIKITECMDDELKSHGINVNCVLPSIIDTPPNRSAMPDADFSRWVSPAQLAQAICFLASDKATGIHGAAVPVKNLI